MQNPTDQKIAITFGTSTMGNSFCTLTSSRPFR